MYDFKAPIKDLEPYVAHLFTVRLEADDQGGAFDELCLPSGHSVMSFHKVGRCRFYFKNQTFVPSRFYTSGQITSNYRIHSDDPEVLNIGAFFKPTGLWHLFGLDMPSITNNVITSETLFEDKLQVFKRSFNKSKSPMECRGLVEQLLFDRLKKVSPKLNMIDESIELIHKNLGCIQIKHITEKLNVSERYFQKKFKIMVGVVPSVYCRIMRFNYLFAGMNPKVPKNHESLSIITRYYDFPHFSNDFKKFCGAPPSKFHVDQFKYVKNYMIDHPISVRI